MDSKTLTIENIPLVALFLALTVFLAITVLFFTRPVFAQSGDGVIAVKPIAVPAPAIAPDLGESWDLSTPSFSDAGLAPAPEEPAETESAPMYLPGSSADLVGPWMNQPIPPGPLQPNMSAEPTRIRRSYSSISEGLSMWPVPRMAPLDPINQATTLKDVRRGVASFCVVISDAFRATLLPSTPQKVLLR